MTLSALAIVTIFVRPDLSSEHLERISSEAKEVVLQAESRLHQGRVVGAVTNTELDWDLSFLPHIKITGGRRPHLIQDEIRPVEERT